jgi:hypothetical protein
MVQFVLFVLLSLLELASLALLFVFKDPLHAVVSLAAAFSISALLFLTLSQPFLALIQLFIMVGGVATYLLVGVAATGASSPVRTNHVALALFAIALFFAIYYGVSGANFIGVQGNLLSGQMIAAGLSQNVPLLYLAMFMLFGIGTGAIVLLRKMG